MILFGGLSDNRIELAPNVDTIDLNPLSREVVFDFDSMFNAGNANNVEVVDGKLMLLNDGFGDYSSEGYWESPVFDTQNEHVFWEWVYSDVDFAGMQENLLHDGDFENPACLAGGTEAPCGYYIQSSALVPPYVDYNYSSSGNSSFRFFFNDSVMMHRGAFYLETGNWIPIDPSKIVHEVFDLKYDTDGTSIEFWNTFGPNNGWTDNVHNGMLVRYSHPIDDFEEQYIMANLTQLSTNLNKPINYLQPLFFEYYSNDDYDNTMWIDNIRIFQDSPINYRVRTSDDDITWSEWTDARYFVAKRTAPGGMPSRYIQFNISLRTDDIGKTPSVNSLKLDYSKAFEFKIDWLHTNSAIFDPIDIEPAGSHGYVGYNSEGNFEFEDGTPIRFWSIQLGDNRDFGDYDNIDGMCKKIRQMGFNMVKITSPLDTDGTLEEWDLFDYMLKSCKDEGIYIYIQLNGGWPWDERKMLPDYWDIAHPDSQKSHITAIMNRVNPYTNISYKDDPQFVFSQITNEKSFHSEWRRYSNGVWNDSYGVYTDLITGHFQDWVVDKYPTFNELQDAWNESGADIFYENESLDYPDNIQIVKFDDWEIFSNERFQDTTKFLAKLHKDYYEEFKDLLINEIGVKSLIVPNNHYYGMAELETRQDEYFVIDQHSYWNHSRQPTHGGEIMSDVPQVKSPGKNIVSYIALDSVEGMPMTVSESNYHIPGLYTQELPLFVSAYSSFQDWDQWTYFIVHIRNMSDPYFKHVPEALNSWFDSGRMALMPAASRIFIDEYIAPGEKEIEISHTQEVVNDYRRNRRTSDFNIPGFTNEFVLTNRINIIDFNASSEKTIQEYYNEFDLTEPRSPYVTDTGELKLDSDRGYLALDAPKVQGFVGETQENIVELGGLKLNIAPKGNNFSSVVLVPLDDKGLYDSERILLTATGRTESSEIQWDADKRGYYDDSWCHWCNQHYGEEPVLVEGINAEVFVKSKFENLQINVLNSSGLRSGVTVNSTKDGEWFNFDISDMDETLWYELVLSGLPDDETPEDPPEDPQDPVDDTPPPSGGSDPYCGDNICSNDESCSCSDDCGECVFSDDWSLSGNEIDITNNAVRVITSGGEYSLIIRDTVEILTVKEIKDDSVVIVVDGREYLVGIEESVEMDVKDYDVYVSYLEMNNGRIMLTFQNEWIRAAEFFDSNSIMYLIVYALLILTVIYYMIKSEKNKK